tara:strand:- start:826 stop:1044 length:219 start_codon:yes stop_codon:yes gene_type:complete
VTNDATLKVLGCHAVAVVGSPAAVASSGKLSSGACPNGAGRDQIFPSRFNLGELVVDPSGSGWHNSWAGLSR